MPVVVLDTNVFVAAGFNPSSNTARILEAVRAGTVQLIWDDQTRRETEYIIGKIPPISGTDLAAFFRSHGRHDGQTDPHAFAFIPDPADRTPG